MSKLFSALLVLALAGSVSLSGQAVNAASGDQWVSPGSLVSLYGNFINATGQAHSLPLPTSVHSFHIVLVQGFSTDFDDVANWIHLLYWSPSQINLLLPDSTQQGAVLGARMNGVGVGSAKVSVSKQAPGIFLNLVTDCSITAAGCSERLTRGILTDKYYNLIGSGNPAHPKQSLIVWCTGLGVKQPAPLVLVLPNTGDLIAGTVFYSGRTSFPGLDQVNIKVPDGNALSQGCMVGTHLEVQLSLKSTVTDRRSNVVPLPVVIDSCN